LVNPGPEPLVIDSVTLVDGLSQDQVPGNDPWTLETLSRENIKKFEHRGRRVLAGVGLGVAWGMSPAIALGGGLSGSATMALAGVTTFFAVPAIVVTNFVVNKHAKRDIKAEFDRRRMALPLELPANGIKAASIFFPISPGPQRLLVNGHSGDKNFSTVIDLSALSGLHLLKQSTSLATADARIP
jgi:hypothetical protein